MMSKNDVLAFNYFIIQKIFFFRFLLIMNTKLFLVGEVHESRAQATILLHFALKIYMFFFYFF